MTGLRPLTQALLADVAPLGRIVEKPIPSGAVRFIIDFGRAATERVYSFPGPGGRPVPFYTREQAQRALDLIGLRVRDGASLKAVLASLRGTVAPVDRIERHIARWLEVWEGRVASGQRSENSLREYRRYAAPDGHFSYWGGKDVRAINRGHLEDYIVWLAARGLKAKSIANVCGAFKAMLAWMVERGDLEEQEVPRFPKITVPEYAPRIISMEELELILDQIPWERRGVFLVCAYEGVRISEARAFGLDDWDGKELNIAKAVGRRIDSPVRANKTHSAVRRPPTVPEATGVWLNWRATDATAAARLRGEALFPNPSAENPTKRWSISAFVREWGRACKAAGVAYVPIGQATRHSSLTAMARAGVSERIMRAHSRHRDSRSLDRYARLAAAPPGALVRVLRPPRPSRDPAE